MEKPKPRIPQKQEKSSPKQEKPNINIVQHRDDQQIKDLAQALSPFGGQREKTGTSEPFTWFSIAKTW